MSLLQGDQIRVVLQSQRAAAPLLFDEASGTWRSGAPGGAGAAVSLMMDDVGEEWLYVGVGTLPAAAPMRQG